MATPQVKPDLDELNNVVITSKTTNDVLKWNGTAWVNSAPSLGMLGNASAQYKVPVSGSTPFAYAESGFMLDGTSGGKTILAVTNTKTLTLTATDNYNLTIPATGTAVLGTGSNTRIGIWSGANTLSYDAPLFYLPHQLYLSESNAAGLTTFFVTNSSATANSQSGFTFRSDLVYLDCVVFNGASGGGGRVTLNANSGYFLLGTATADGVFINTNATTRIGIDSAGKIGLGTSAPTTQVHVFLNNATTNAIDNILTIEHDTTGTAANGFGTGMLWTLESSTTANTNAALITTSWVDATHASRKAKMDFSVYDTSARSALTLQADGVAGITRSNAASEGAYATTAVDLTLTSAHHWVTVTVAKTITFPASAGCVGRVYIITALADGVILDANGSELINGELTQTLLKYDTAQMRSDGVGWYAT